MLIIALKFPFICSEVRVTKEAPLTLLVTFVSRLRTMLPYQGVILLGQRLIRNEGFAQMRIRDRRQGRFHLWIVLRLTFYRDEVKEARISAIDIEL
jgi:hypothetical protein